MYTGKASIRPFIVIDTLRSMTFDKNHIAVNLINFQ